MIAYGNPFIPVEWLAAHGVQPHWLRLPDRSLSRQTGSDQDQQHHFRALNSLMHGRRGVCPLAGAVADAVSAGIAASAVVLTTACDQMRHAASLLEHQHGVPVFVMNVPSTWRTESSRALYLAELQRLGGFLVDRGGARPSTAELVEVMLRFDRARALLRRMRHRLPSREFAGALLAVREDASRLGPWDPYGGDREDHRLGREAAFDQECSPESTPYVPLALVGGPMRESDYGLFDWVQQAGGQIVLDATEWGERTLPRAFEIERAHRDPLTEVADAYFGSIPDVFRRPNDALYGYLGRELAARQARGLIVRRYLWCDLWHAEVAVLKAWSPVPVLDLDAADSESSSEGRTRGRVEAFLEMLI